MGSTGREQPASHSGNLGAPLSCDAKCDAISADRVELLARAVTLVAASQRKVPAAALLAAGTVVFSGSLYALVLTNVKALGAVTPVGGLLMVGGWLALLV